MKNTKNLIQSFAILMLGLLASQQAISGGGWPQPKGKGYFKLAEWWIKADQHYTDAGRIDPNITTAIYSTTFYGEYGFTDRLTGIVYFPFFSRALTYNQVSNTTGEILIPGEAINSIGDTDISFKYGVTKPGSPIAVSASVLFGLPLGKDVGGTLNNLQTGDGEFNQMFRIDAGTSFRLIPNTSSYVNIYSGVNNRTNDFSDEFRYGLELGIGLASERLWFAGKLDGVESFRNGATAAEVTSTSIFANNTEFTSFTMEAAYYVKDNIGVSASIGTAFRGEIILARPSYSVGVFLHLR